MSTHAVWRQVPAVLLIVGLAGAACGDDRSPEPPATPPTSETFTAADGTRYAVEVVLRGLEVPWSMAFAPDGRLFITERPGRVRVAQNGALLPQPMLTVGDVAANGEAGVMGLALHPNFSSNRFVYIAYTSRVAGRDLMVNRIVRFRELNNQLGESVVIFDNVGAANIHDGGRIRFGPDGKLYLTMGDAAEPSLSQDLASNNGKILRMNDDGSLPADNPFPGSFVYSLGHRNPQGIDWQPGTGELWGTEHGATGNDEVNRLQPGRNYGWPVIEANRTQAGMETPVLFYDPAIAPSGFSFYTPAGGTAIEGFRNNAFFATLRGTHLHRVVFNPGDPRTVRSEERLLEGRFGRIRDVITGPDGAIYFCTNNRDGRGTPTSDDDRVVRVVAAR